MTEKAKARIAADKLKADKARPRIRAEKAGLKNIEKAKEDRITFGDISDLGATAWILSRMVANCGFITCSHYHSRKQANCRIFDDCRQCRKAIMRRMKMRKHYNPSVHDKCIRLKASLKNRWR